jgi:hypothetical protein
MPRVGLSPSDAEVAARGWMAVLIQQLSIPPILKRRLHGPRVTQASTRHQVTPHSSMYTIVQVDGQKIWLAQEVPCSTPGFRAISPQRRLQLRQPQLQQLGPAPL